MLSAQEGNYKFENYGSRSILLSGSVTGSVEDLELAYYNPARLAQVDNPIFSINAKAYQWNLIKIRDAFDDEEELKSSQFGGIPSMLVGAFKIKKWEKHQFAYSFITKSRSNYNLSFDSGLREEDIIDIVPGPEEINSVTSLGNNLKEEWFGLSWAMPIDSTFSVGASLFGSTYRLNSSNNRRVSIDTEEGVIAYNQLISFTQKSYGVFAKLALAWKLDKMDLGLTVSLPYLAVYNKGKFSYEEVLAGSGSDLDFLTKVGFNDLDSNRRVPLSIAVGAGIPIGRTTISANLEWYSGTGNYRRINIPSFDRDESNEQLDELSFNLNEELRSIVNFAVGVEFFISERLKGYGSFSTDFSAYKDNPNIFDLIDQTEEDINFRQDYYHVGGGVELIFNWANLILGANFAQASANFRSPEPLPLEYITTSSTNGASLINTRWQFIIGIDIPFLDDLNPLTRKEPEELDE
ncbi:hypothetical protein [Aureitalea marina]|uniref:hypothetical protein n=1 Tax=Aureitalea marina TaxID=930804 RepID=UPI0011B00688|nr:hypothetical protein [Aureitalea marina]